MAAAGCLFRRRLACAAVLSVPLGPACQPRSPTPVPTSSQPREPARTATGAGSRAALSRSAKSERAYVARSRFSAAPSLSPTEASRGTMDATLYNDHTLSDRDLAARRFVSRTFLADAGPGDFLVPTRRARSHDDANAACAEHRAPTAVMPHRVRIATSRAHPLLLPHQGVSRRQAGTRRLPGVSEASDLATTTRAAGLRDETRIRLPLAGRHKPAQEILARILV